MTLRRRRMSNQRWNKVLHVIVQIYNIEQRQINVVYFIVGINNVRQRRNNVLIFNVKFNNVDQRRNNLFNIAKKFFWASKKKNIAHLINNTGFWLWSIKKKGKHGTLNAKTNVEKNMKIMVSLFWWQKKLMYRIALLVHIYRLLCF